MRSGHFVCNLDRLLADEVIAVDTVPHNQPVFILAAQHVSAVEALAGKIPGLIRSHIFHLSITCIVL